MTYVFDGTLSFTQPTNSCQFIFGLVFMYFLLVVSLVVSVNAVLCVEYRGIMLHSPFLLVCVTVMTVMDFM